MKIEKKPTFTALFCDLRTRKIKNHFSNSPPLLDWERISLRIDTHYQKGKSASGKPNNAGLSLF
jgi:hypothetical protein